MNKTIGEGWEVYKTYETIVNMHQVVKSLQNVGIVGGAAILAPFTLSVGEQSCQ
jgi:hypothetical protein